jgi:hypothetical protein
LPINIFQWVADWWGEVGEWPSKQNFFFLSSSFTILFIRPFFLTPSPPSRHPAPPLHLTAAATARAEHFLGLRAIYGPGRAEHRWAELRHFKRIKSFLAQS